MVQNLILSIANVTVDMEKAMRLTRDDTRHVERAEKNAIELALHIKHTLAHAVAGDSCSQLVVEVSCYNWRWNLAHVSNAAVVAGWNAKESAWDVVIDHMDHRGPISHLDAILRCHDLARDASAQLVAE